MVNVPNGRRSSGKPQFKTGRSDYPIVIVHRDIMFKVEYPSRLDGGLWMTMCSAVTRQCNLYRTVLLQDEPTPAQSRALLVRWIRSLPVDKLR